MLNLLNCLASMVLVLMVFFFENRASANEPTSDWGTLTGRFVYDGVPPKRELLELNKDIAFCGALKPRDEELIVNPKTRGVQNVVLWLEPKSKDEPVPVHPSYEKTAKAKVRFDNADCQFQPHVCAVRTTQTLVIGNKDKINHNAAMFFFYNDPFNENIPTGETVEKHLTRSEKLPAKVSCPIHAWMVGYVIVKDHPYVAITDADGKFELKNLPAGECTIRVWHEKIGYIKEAAVSEELQTWEAGRASLNVKPGNNSWGDVKLSPSLFEK